MDWREIEQALDRYQSECQRRRGECAAVERAVAEASQASTAAAARAESAEQARTVLQEVAQQTQQGLEYRVGELVTLALTAVFPAEPYKFITRFTQRRGRTEADLLFEKAGEEIAPGDATGGGPVDVAAFALRVSLFTLLRPPPRQTIVLDEPLRFVSTGALPAAGTLLREVADRLGVQFIVVSHEEELAAAAHRLFRVQVRAGGRREVETNE